LGTGRKGGDCDPRGDQTKRNVPHDLPHLAGLLLWQCIQQRGNRTPALTRYFQMATIQAPVRDALSSYPVFRCRYHQSGEGTAAAIEAIVGAGPASSLSALPLRRELLAIKAHAALGLEGVTALGQFAGMAK
jgi:hypothetical protein